MGVGDKSKLSYDDVCELCPWYSRGNSKIGKGPRDTSSKLIKPAARTGVTRVQMGNLFENFKTYILSNLSSRLGVLQAKKKHEGVEKDLVVLCSKCRKKTSLEGVSRN